jgi:hypothetical protein
MRCCAAPLLLIALVAGCGRGKEGASADSAAPDTAAIRAAESAPHPTPAAADSMADSARRRRP